MLIDGGEYGTKALLDALGLKDEWHTPRWPLPNLKATTSDEFWSWQCSYSYTAKAHIVRDYKIDGEWADIFIFRMPDVGSFIDGGFAVTVFRNYPSTTVKFYEWRACEHDFEITDSRNCYRKYTCRACGKSYDEHSD